MLNGTQNPPCGKNDYGLFYVFIESVFYTVFLSKTVQYSTRGQVRLVDRRCVGDDDSINAY